nr:hypothetical protein [Actinoplanes polyasparticus]
MQIMKAEIGGDTNSTSGVDPGASAGQYSDSGSANQRWKIVVAG